MADVQTAPHLDDDNPWPGLDSYTEVAQRYFHGRDQDSADLVRLVRMSSFVLLYGKSGLGKSSMLQAGVFPQLRKARLLPVYLRLDYTEAADQPPLAQALGRLLKDAADADMDAAPPAPDESLWAYLQRRERPIWTRDNFPVTPVLVFDQFEEVFSRGGSPEHVRQVLDELAALVGDRPPSGLARDGEAAKQLNLMAQQYRVVLSFRSDFLAEIVTWAKHDGLPKHDEQHLEAMTRDIAVDAVERAGAAVLEPGVAAQIVDFVIGRNEAGVAGTAMRVEPVLLSLCCYQLNTRRHRPARIDSALLASVGQDILLDFYRDALAGTDARVSKFIEDNLIQGGRYRSSFPRQEALDSGMLTATELDTLQKRRLLRVDVQGDVPRIELIHDRLVGIVRDAREARRAQEQAALARAEAAEQADAARAASLKKAQDERAAERLREVQREAKRVGRWRNALGGALVLLALALGGVYNRAERAQTAEAAAKLARARADDRALQAFDSANQARDESDAARRERNRADGLAANAKKEQDRALAGEAEAKLQTRLANDAFRRAQAYLLAARSEGMLGGTGERNDRLAFQQLLVAKQLLPGADARGTQFDPGSALFDALVARQHLRALDPLVLRMDSVPVAVAISADSRWLAVGHTDGSITLRTLDKPQAVVHRVQEHSDTVQFLAFSADSKSLASASDDGRVGRWRVDGLAPLGPLLSGHAEGAYGVAFDRDGKHIASSGADGKVRLWDAVTGAPLREFVLPEATGTVWAVAFSPRNPQVLAATGSTRKTGGSYLSVFNLASTEPPVSHYAHGEDSMALAFSPAGNAIVTGSVDKSLRVRHLGRAANDPGATQRLSGHQDEVWTVAYSPDGRWIASGSVDRSVRLWRVGSGEPIGLPLVGYGSNVTSAAFSGDGRWLATASDDGTLRLWPLAPAWAVGATDWPAPGTDARAVALARDGHLAALALEGGQGTVLLRDDTRAVARELMARAEAEHPPRGPLAACRDDAKAAGPANNSRGLTSGQRASAQPPKRYSFPVALALRPDGARLAAAYDDGSVRQWDTATLLMVGLPLQLSGCKLLSLAYSADGARLAAVDQSGQVIAVGPQGELLEKPRRVAGAQRVAISGSGQRIAVSGADLDGDSTRPWMRLFAVGKPGEGQALDGAIEAATALAFSPDGAQLVSGSGAGQVRVWDALNGRALSKPHAAHVGPVSAITFATDGSRFVTAGRSGVPRSWPAAPATWVEQMCAKVGSNMSRESWARNVSPTQPYVCQCPGKPIDPDAQGPTGKPAMCPAGR